MNECEVRISELTGCATANASRANNKTKFFIALRSVFAIILNETKPNQNQNTQDVKTK